MEPKQVLADDIRSVSNEERIFYSPANFAAVVRFGPQEFSDLYCRADTDYPAFWADLARQHLLWHKAFSVTLDERHAPNYRWFGRTTSGIEPRRWLSKMAEVVDLNMLGQ